MNARNAFSRDNSSALNTRFRVRRTRRRNVPRSSATKTWFTSADVTPDHERREVVTQRFMSMNEAHDRIRTELLASRAAGTR
jgi:hypothetical protein